MSTIFTSLLRHVAPIIAVYATNPEVKTQVAVAVTAGLAWLWSVAEKKLADVNRL